ncbi:MAG: site-specific integrase [Clostridiales bacterium]|nr:site-specific integrase [Clostridiales bacterium]
MIVKDKKIKNVRPAFNIFEQEKILNHIKSKDCDFYKIILFYLSTGVRRSEALTITPNDFDGLKLHINGTKTIKADRNITITEDLKKVIYNENKYIFNYKENFVTKKFKTYINEIGLSGTLHSLRHSYATNQYYLGTPAKEVQILMGHSEINITLDVYTNIEIAQNKNEIIDKIKQVYNKYYIQLQS